MTIYTPETIGFLRLLFGLWGQGICIIYGNIP